MLQDPVRPYVRRRRVKPRGATIVAGPLLLTAATYQSGVSVTLTFGRAVNAGAIDGTKIRVDDVDDTGMVYAATGAATYPSPTTVVLALEPIGDDPFGDISLTATPGNGIMAAADGTAWAGVTGLELPYGG